MRSSLSPVLVVIVTVTLLVGGVGLMVWRLLRWSPDDDLPARWTVEDDEVALGLARADMRAHCRLPWAMEGVVLSETSVEFDRYFATVEGRVTVEGQALPFALRAERRPRFEGFSGPPSWSVERLSVSLPDGGVLRCAGAGRPPAPAE